MQLILLFSNPYTLTQDDGEIKEGLSLSFLGKANLNPFELDNVKGARPFKDSLPLSFQDKIKSVPGLYEVETMLSADSQGKAKMKVIDLFFVGELKTTLVPPPTK